MRVVALLAVLVSGLASAKPVTVIYPRVAANGTDVFGYRVLKLALDKSGADYRLRLTRATMNHKRARRMIREGRVSVFDFGTSPRFEREFLPIYFPIDRGLNGWRLLVIRRDRQADFSRVTSLQGLRQMTAGQGPWSDTPILESAGIRVTTAPFESLFRMVGAGRFDFFPLGVNEIYGLLAANRGDDRNLVVEKHLVLIYPFGRFFFVRRGNQHLHDIIARGLKRAWKDGSFEKLFYDDPALKQALKQAGLKRRTVIRIPNPFLSSRFRQIPLRYFFSL